MNELTNILDFFKVPFGILKLPDGAHVQGTRGINIQFYCHLSMGYICAVQTSSHAAPVYIEMYRKNEDFHGVFEEIVTLFPPYGQFRPKKLYRSHEKTLPDMSDYIFIFFCGYLPNKQPLETGYLRENHSITILTALRMSGTGSSTQLGIFPIISLPRLQKGLQKTLLFAK